MLRPKEYIIQAPSKEGASQSPPTDIRVWVDTEVLRRNYDRQDVADAARSMGMAMYRKLQEEIDQVVENAVAFSKLSVKQTNDIVALQSQLSSMKAERDEAVKEADNMLQGREIDKRQMRECQAERDLYKKEVQTWKDECNTVGALLEGKNLENAGLKDEITAYRKALEPGTSVMTQIEILEKYKKEELK